MSRSVSAFVGLVVVAGMVGCAPSPDAANTRLPDAADQTACDDARTVIGVAEIGLPQLVRQPAQAAQKYLDYASQVRSATGEGSTGVVDAGARVAAVYERLSTSAVIGSAPDTDALREAVATFVDVCGTGDPFTPIGTG